MGGEDRTRNRAPRGRIRRFAKGLLGALGPSERSILTREGLYYFAVSLALLVAGLIQQVNLILLVFTLAAGPFLASIFGGRSMLRRLTVQRRIPPYVFSGDPLQWPENQRTPHLTRFIELTPFPPLISKINACFFGGMSSFMKNLTPAELLARLKTLVADERRATLLVIECLEEVQERRLYAEWGYGSLWEFATIE